MSERMKLPPEKDCGFYQRRKHDKWREVAPPDPPLEGPVADSHAHVHSLPDPAWELVRCAANNVKFVCEICDPSEDALDIPGDVRKWQAVALGELTAKVPELLERFCYIGDDRNILRRYLDGVLTDPDEVYARLVR